jgi:hypothetical protein
VLRAKSLVVETWMPSIFLSYRRDDSAGYAGRLRSSLENRLGAGSVFRDVDVIEPGQDFVDTIEARVRACRVFLALIGQEWIDARNAAGERRLDDEEDYLRREVAVALARPDLRVIPVLVEGAAVPGTTQLPPDLWALSRRHAVSLRDETWESDVDRLTEAVRKVVGQAKAEEAVGRGRPRRVHPALWTLVGAAAVIVAIALPRLMPGGDVPSSSNVDGASSSSTGASVGDRGTRVALPAEGVTIAIPRISEIEMGEQIYSLVAGSLAPRGDSMTLRLRSALAPEATGRERMPELPKPGSRAPEIAPAGRGRHARASPMASVSTPERTRILCKTSGRVAVRAPVRPADAIGSSVRTGASCR